MIHRSSWGLKDDVQLDWLTLVRFDVRVSVAIGDAFLLLSSEVRNELSMREGLAGIAVLKEESFAVPFWGLGCPPSRFKRRSYLHGLGEVRSLRGHQYGAAIREVAVARNGHVVCRERAASRRDDCVAAAPAMVATASRSVADASHSFAVDCALGRPSEDDPPFTRFITNQNPRSVGVFTSKNNVLLEG